MDVKVGVVSLDLMQEREDGTTKPFAAAEISNISVNVAMKSNAFMKIDGSVGALNLLDKREDGIIIRIGSYMFFDA